MRMSIHGTNNAKSLRVVFVVAIMATLCFYASGCTMNHTSYMANDHRYRVTKMEKILNALKNEDSGAIKKLMSKKAIDTVGEAKLDEGIEYLFTVFQGDVISFDMKAEGDSAQYDGGKMWAATNIDAEVVTDQDSYYIASPDVIIDQFDPSRVGIGYMAILRLDDIPVYGFPSNDFLGIFRQDIIDRALLSGRLEEDKLAAVVAALESKDKDAFKSLFSNKTIEQHIDTDTVRFDKKTEAAFSKFSGKVTETIIVNHEYEYINISEGEVQMTIKVFANVTTDEDEYSISCRYILDESDPNNTGVELVGVIYGKDRRYLEDTWYGVSSN